MKLSSKGRYGTRFMPDLAIHYGEGPVPLRDTAKRQQISEKYLWTLVGPLTTAGLVNSSRGSHGGHTPAKPPAGTNLKDVVHTVEGALCLVDCVDDPSVCDWFKNCVARDIWGEASDKLRDVFESVTLKDMVRRRLDNR